MADVSAALTELLQSLRPEKILEIGCGDGEFTEVLVEHLYGFGHIEATDAEESAVEEARDYFDRAHTNAPVSFSVADASSLPWADGTFDMVVLSNTIHHLRDADRVFEEVFRVIHSSGQLLVHEMVADVDDPRQEVGRDLHHLKAWVDRTQGIAHGPTWTRSGLEEILRTHHFENCERREYSPAPVLRTDTDLEDRIEHIDDYTEHAADTPAYSDIRREVLRLRQRIRAVGFTAPPQLLMLCRKAASSETETRRNP
ncbi:MAG: class I SAM-dependent methyltransferase [Spirochaetota bacterium]